MMQNKFSSCVPCSAVIYFCIFSGFVHQLLSAHKIMKRIAMEGKMGHGMWGNDVAVEELNPYLDLTMK